MTGLSNFESNENSLLRVATPPNGHKYLLIENYTFINRKWNIINVYGMSWIQMENNDSKNEAVHVNSLYRVDVEYLSVTQWIKVLIMSMYVTVSWTI